LGSTKGEGIVVGSKRSFGVRVNGRGVYTVNFTGFDLFDQVSVYDPGFAAAYSRDACLLIRVDFVSELSVKLSAEDTMRSGSSLRDSKSKLYFWNVGHFLFLLVQVSFHVTLI